LGWVIETDHHRKKRSCAQERKKPRLQQRCLAEARFAELQQQRDAQGAEIELLRLPLAPEEERRILGSERTGPGIPSARLDIDRRRRGVQEAPLLAGRTHHATAFARALNASRFRQSSRIESASASSPPGASMSITWRSSRSLRIPQAPHCTGIRKRSFSPSCSAIPDCRT